MIILLNMSDFPKIVPVNIGGEFTSQTFRVMCKVQTITVAFTTHYHPLGNFITGSMHRTLKNVLACLCNGHPLRWPKILLRCQAVMNTILHTTTGQPRFISCELPSTNRTDEGISEVRAIVQDTHQKMARRYRAAQTPQREESSVTLY